MRKLLVLAIASCSSPAPTPAEPIVAGEVCEVDPWDRAHTEIWSEPRFWLWFRDRLAPFSIPEFRGKVVDVAATPHSATTSVHGASITVLAATEDGSLAVTADAFGGVRLWPSLDGKREPVVVAAHPPGALAVTRVDPEIAIAGLDVAGKLELVRTTPAGEPRGRAVVEASRPYRSISALPGGFLAIRDDQRIDRIDAQGAIVASLVPEPGSRVGSIAVRRGKAIALIASGDGVRGRWLDLAAGLVWGDTTPKLPIDPSFAALSPDHRHLMAIYPPLDTAATVDLATGRAFAIPWERPEFKEPMRPLGFTTPSVLAVTSTFGGGILWWHDDATTRGFSTFDEVTRTGPTVAVDGRAITGWGDTLVLSTPDESETRYLGYRTVGLQQIDGVRDGWIASSFQGKPMLLLDAQFHLRRRFDAPLGTSHMVFIDERHAVAMLDVDRGRARNLYSVDLLHPDANELAWQTTGYLVVYEPSTHLIAVSEDEVIQFAYVDPKTGVIGNPIPFAVPGHAYQHQVFPLDPARNKRNVALVIATDYTNKTLTATEIRAVTDEVQVARTYDLDQTKPNIREKVLRDHGLNSEGRPMSRRSPDGKWVAEADGRRLTLRDRDGKVKWVVDAHGATELAWRPNGELAVLGAGIASIDLDTGAFRDRQCGWDFGLWSEPLRDRVFGPLICDAP